MLVSSRRPPWRLASSEDADSNAKSHFAGSYRMARMRVSEGTDTRFGRYGCAFRTIRAGGVGQEFCRGGFQRRRDGQEICGGHQKFCGDSHNYRRGHQKKMWRWSRGAQSWFVGLWGHLWDVMGWLVGARGYPWGAMGWSVGVCGYPWCAVRGWCVPLATL